jgi:hypothetical protein
MVGGRSASWILASSNACYFCEHILMDFKYPVHEALVPHGKAGNELRCLEKSRRLSAVVCPVFKHV